MIELILGINISNSSSIPRSSIALNPWQKKQKQNNENIKIFQNAVFIANSFWNLIIILANALYYK